MAVVTLPFFSYHATGSIGKKLTCRSLIGLKFVMARHTPEHIHRSAGQDIAPNLQKWKVARMNTFISQEFGNDRPYPLMD